MKVLTFAAILCLGHDCAVVKPLVDLDLPIWADQLVPSSGPLPGPGLAHTTTRYSDQQDQNAVLGIAVFVPDNQRKPVMAAVKDHLRKAYPSKKHSKWEQEHSSKPLFFGMRISEETKGKKRKCKEKLDRAPIKTVFQGKVNQKIESLFPVMEENRGCSEKNRKMIGVESVVESVNGELKVQYEKSKKFKPFTERIKTTCSTECTTKMRTTIAPWKIYLPQSTKRTCVPGFPKREPIFRLRENPEGLLNNRLITNDELKDQKALLASVQYINSKIREVLDRNGEALV